ncbi:transposase family protein, partial [Streptococcus pneumoniae]|uniref:transposase family protein n=1 Tax=Streptococcus pneumoniae TaxID=1313 RepID=UPI000AE84995
MEQLHFITKLLDIKDPNIQILDSKIPYLETTGMPTRILLRKRRFKCYHCSKMM